MARALVDEEIVKRRNIMGVTIGQEARTMRYIETNSPAECSLRVARRFLSSRLAEELLEKAYACLV